LRITADNLFFFILEGEAFFNLEDIPFHLKKHEGLEIPLKKKHQIINSGENNLVFLLMSFPPVQEDDIRV